MKIRDGQVSNSSSSTFILITTKENYEACLKEASELSRIIAKKKLREDKIRLLGRNMVKFVMHYSDESAFSGWSEELPKKFFKEVPLKESDDEDEWEYGRRCDEKVEEAWNAFVEMLEKNKNETFSASESN